MDPVGVESSFASYFCTPSFFENLEKSDQPKSWQLILNISSVIFSLGRQAADLFEKRQLFRLDAHTTFSNCELHARVMAQFLLSYDSIAAECRQLTLLITEGEKDLDTLKSDFKENFNSKLNRKRVKFSITSFVENYLMRAVSKEMGYLLYSVTASITKVLAVDENGYLKEKTDHTKIGGKIEAKKQKEILQIARVGLTNASYTFARVRINQMCLQYEEKRLEIPRKLLLLKEMLSENQTRRIPNGGMFCSQFFRDLLVLFEAMMDNRLIALSRICRKGEASFRLFYRSKSIDQPFEQLEREIELPSFEPVTVLEGFMDIENGEKLENKIKEVGLLEFLLAASSVAPQQYDRAFRGLTVKPNDDAENEIRSYQEKAIGCELVGTPIFDWVHTYTNTLEGESGEAADWAYAST